MCVDSLHSIILFCRVWKILRELVLTNGKKESFNAGKYFCQPEKTVAAKRNNAPLFNNNNNDNNHKLYNGIHLNTTTNALIVYKYI